MHSLFLDTNNHSTQFASSNFQKFHEKRGISHIKTPSCHLQSNGQTERFEEIVKYVLTKTYCDDSPDNKENFLEYLSQYRATAYPHARRLQTTLICWKLSSKLVTGVTRLWRINTTGNMVVWNVALQPGTKYTLRYLRGIWCFGSTGKCIVCCF